MIDYYLITVGVILLLSLAMIIFAKTSSNKSLAHRNRFQEVQLQHQKELLLNSFEIQERERKRIAHELHDDIGNKLNVISIMLKNQNISSANESVSLQDLINTTIETTRRISHELHPPMLEKFGLEIILEEYKSQLANRYQVFHSYTRNQAEFPLNVKLQIFRIVQEFVSNTIKHAEANKIIIQIKACNGNIYIRLADDGIGYDLALQPKGMGIQNIISRAESLDGQYKIKTTLNGGVTLLLKLKSWHK